MHKLAFDSDDFCPAETAHTPAAQVGNLYARRLYRLEECLIGRHMNVQVRLREVSIERIARRWSAELLPVNVAVRPATCPGSRNGATDNGRPSADIEMRPQRLLRQQRLEVDARAGAAVVHAN